MNTFIWTVPCLHLRGENRKKCCRRLDPGCGRGGIIGNWGGNGHVRRPYARKLAVYAPLCFSSAPESTGYARNHMAYAPEQAPYARLAHSTGGHCTIRQKSGGDRHLLTGTFWHLLAATSYEFFCFSITLKFVHTGKRKQ